MFIILLPNQVVTSRHYSFMLRWAFHGFMAQCVIEFIALSAHLPQVSLDALFRSVVCVRWIGVGWVRYISVRRVGVAGAGRGVGQGSRRRGGGGGGGGAFATRRGRALRSIFSEWLITGVGVVMMSNGKTQRYLSDSGDGLIMKNNTEGTWTASHTS
jgi:hypothetical protein